MMEQKIYAPNNYIGQARIVAASTNSVAGVEVLESIEIGVSPYMEKTMKNLATEGELSKTINALEMIEASRVHIVEPEDSPFYLDRVKVLLVWFCGWLRMAIMAKGLQDQIWIN